MKTIALIAVILCFSALSLLGICADAPTGKVIHSYEGNLSEKNTTQATLMTFGKEGYFLAETVKFKAPSPGWKIESVQLYGWDGYNGTYDSVPSERVIALEIRDKDLKLLYHFADSQLPYTNYAQNYTGIFPMLFPIPSIAVSDEFYVCFYDRSAVAVGCELLQNASTNSFIFIQPGNIVMPANLPGPNNSIVPVNWIMTIKGS